MLKKKRKQKVKNVKRDRYIKFLEARLNALEKKVGDHEEEIETLNFHLSDFDYRLTYSK